MLINKAKITAIDPNLEKREAKLEITMCLREAKTYHQALLKILYLRRDYWQDKDLPQLTGEQLAE